jgi:hypothetical protein
MRMEAAAVLRSAVSDYLSHFLLMGLGEERLCGDTATVFGPGFLPTLWGRHLALSAICAHLLSGACMPLAIGNKHLAGQADGSWSAQSQIRDRASSQKSMYSERLDGLLSVSLHPVFCLTVEPNRLLLRREYVMKPAMEIAGHLCD